MKPAASALVAYGMAVLAVAVAAMFGAAWWRAGGGSVGFKARRILLAVVVIAAWMAFSAVLAMNGVLAQFDRRPPPFALFLIVMFGFSLGLGLSSVGKQLAEGLPVWMLIGMQAFRLPLELIMHQAAREGVMPVQMSYAGWNFDIATGITAIGVAWLAARGRASAGLLMAWNVMGILLLVNILAIAITSTPLFHSFGVEPSKVNTWVAYFPFVWLPGTLVPAAILGHVIITRSLLRKVGTQRHV
jgi:hypothetical protein